MRRLAVSVGLVLLLTAGCTDDPEVSPEAERCGLRGTVSDIKPRLSPKTYIGKTLAEAKRMAEAAGGSLRLVGQDGTCGELADNFFDDRINVYVVDGRVTDAAVF